MRRDSHCPEHRRIHDTRRHFAFVIVLFALATGLPANAAEGDRIRVTGEQNLGGHTNSVFAIEHWPIHQQLLSAGADKQIIAWDTTTWRPLRVSSEPQGGMLDLAVSPQSGEVYAGGDPGELLCLNSADLALKHRQSFGFRCSRFDVYSPRAWVAVGGVTGSVQLYDARARKVLRAFPLFHRRVLGLAFSEDGNMLYAAGDRPNSNEREFHLVEIQTYTGQSQRLLDLPGRPVRMERRGARLLLTAGNEALVYDVTQRQLLHRWRVDDEQSLEQLIEWPEHKLFVSCSAKGRVHFWEPGESAPVGSFVACERGVFQIAAINPQTLVTAAQDGRRGLTVWTLAVQEPPRLAVRPTKPNSPETTSPQKPLANKPAMPANKPDSTPDTSLKPPSPTLTKPQPSTSPAASATPSTPPRVGRLRRWRDISDQHTVEGELVACTLSDATLKRADGRTLTLPISRFHEADQALLLASELRQKWLAQADSGAAAATTANGTPFPAVPWQVKADPPRKPNWPARMTKLPVDKFVDPPRVYGGNALEYHLDVGPEWTPSPKLVFVSQSGWDGGISLVDPYTGKFTEIRFGNRSPDERPGNVVKTVVRNQAAISSDGKLLAFFESPTSLTILSIANHRRLHELPVQEVGHGCKLEFIDDRRLLAYEGTLNLRRLRLYDAPTGRCLWSVLVSGELLREWAVSPGLNQVALFLFGVHSPLVQVPPQIEALLEDPSAASVIIPGYAEKRLKDRGSLTRLFRRFPQPRPAGAEHKPTCIVEVLDLKTGGTLGIAASQGEPQGQFGGGAFSADGSQLACMFIEPSTTIFNGKCSLTCQIEVRDVATGGVAGVWPIHDKLPTEPGMWPRVWYSQTHLRHAGQHLCAVPGHRGWIINGIYHFHPQSSTPLQHYYDNVQGELIRTSAYFLSKDQFVVFTPFHLKPIHFLKFDLAAPPAAKPK